MLLFCSSVDKKVKNFIVEGNGLYGCWDSDLNVS